MSFATSNAYLWDRKARISGSVTRSTSGFGHGKIILLGEHAVVFGHPALAAGISTGVRAQARPGEGRIRIPAWNVEARVRDGSPIGTALARLLARLGTEELDLRIDAEIPARAGLGSSAALAVAVARAASGRSGTTETNILAAVAASETVFHGKPSGVDATAALHGGLGAFYKEKGWQPIHLSRPLEVCIGLSGVPHDTGWQVEAVARLCARDPVARDMIGTLGEITRVGIEALTLGDVSSLGSLFDAAHGQLTSLGLSSAELDALVRGARAGGALGAKLTGAGAGGAVIALAPGRTREVLASWKALGFAGFTAVVGNA